MPTPNHAIVRTLSLLFCCWLLIGSLGLGAMVVMNPSWDGPSAPLMLSTLWLPSLCLALLQAHRLLGVCLAVLSIPVWLILRLVERIRHGNRGDHPQAVRHS